MILQRTRLTLRHCRGKVIGSYFLWRPLDRAATILTPFRAEELAEGSIVTTRMLSEPARWPCQPTGDRSRESRSRGPRIGGQDIGPTKQPQNWRASSGKRKAIVAGSTVAFERFRNSTCGVLEPDDSLRRYALMGCVLRVQLATVALVLAVSLRSPLPAPTILRTIQITDDHRQKTTPLVTDGTRVYFNEEVGGHWIPVCVSTDGGETAPVPMPLPAASLCDISPQGNELLVTSGDSRGLWVVPTAGGTARRLGDLEAVSEAKWSPDGERLLYIKEREENLYLAKSDGTQSRKLITAPRWSVFDWLVSGLKAHHRQRPGPRAEQHPVGGFN